MDSIIQFFKTYVTKLTIPQLTVIDVLEILIIAYIFYHIIIWVKDTRAWTLLKGMVFLAVFYVLAVILEMNVIVWLFNNVMVVGAIALVVIFQPELRGALEHLGRRNLLRALSIDSGSEKKARYSAKSVQAIVKATFDMAKVKTGALIVVEENIQCREYERTGIPINADISSQLLINIFEHNTPLHDGAVLMRDDQIVAATCYLPLSNNLEVSKDLGTRHRAGLGISEVSDSLTIIVSEETGAVSLAKDGVLYHKIDADTLALRLKEAAKQGSSEKAHWWQFRKKKHIAEATPQETESSKDEEVSGS
ncbi:MAG: diadenylate cyclase CdaA [Eubacterium sp.]|nr:diadenylate cyclase CdaA [Eubacterium sp.]